MNKNKKKIPDFIRGMQSWFMVEFVDEGIDRAVNTLVEKGAINTLLLGTHNDPMSTKNWGELGHSENRVEHIGSGFLYDFDISKFKTTRIKPVKNTEPEIEDRDIFGEVLKEAKKAGMQVYALICHRMPNARKFPELHMRATNGGIIPKVLCHSQPEVREFYKCMVDDLMNRYPLDGFCFDLLDHYHQFGFETLTDELADVLGIRRFSNPEMGLSCFCDECVRRAKDAGIDVERIRKGLLNGIKLGWIPHGVERATSAGDAFRLLLDVPEYLEWLRFRATLITEVHKELKDYIESKNKDMIVSLDAYGAEDAWKYAVNYKTLTEQCDWIKPMFYSGTYPGTPLTPEMIGEHVKKSVEGAGKTIPIVPGVSGAVKQSTEKIRASIEESVANGASGIILSWDYSLISYENMETYRDVLSELKKIGGDL